MHSLYNDKAPKKATNLSVNSDLLKRSRALKINLSATLEQALKAKLAQAEGKQWADENSSAITAYNEFVKKNGCFSDAFRAF
ncbi:MAG: type II toxin-antitoxin system CcdA family antitoxin [Immundisolibacteraceae bacterium]|nr:type II toxin-antitoxin system CcdA family antitoxin [Immundisolibacteraceae bacterium]